MAVRRSFRLWPLAFFSTTAPPAERRNEEINLPLMPSSFASVAEDEGRTRTGLRDAGTTSAMGRGGDVHVQSTALGHFQGFVKSFLGSSTGRWAILQLLGSQARKKLKELL